MPKKKRKRKNSTKKVTRAVRRKTETKVGLSAGRNLVQPSKASWPKL